MTLRFWADLAEDAYAALKDTIHDFNHTHFTLTLDKMVQAFVGDRLKHVCVKPSNALQVRRLRDAFGRHLQESLPRGFYTDLQRGGQVYDPHVTLVQEHDHHKQPSTSKNALDILPLRIPVDSIVLVESYKEHDAYLAAAKVWLK